MAKVRQQQQELEKKLSQAEEGCLNFNQILKKLNSTLSQTQKERYESELKKEIQRLQRTRESLRNNESQDPRNKSRIIDIRRKIEELIEIHNQTEKEPKTKVFAKESLMIASKIDLSEEQRDMIKALQRSFYDKINTREAELEKAKSQKSKPGTIDEISKHIKNLRNHYEKLEQLLKLIENNPVTLEQLWPLTDKLQNYLKTDDTEDLETDLEQRYKEFNFPISKIMSNFPALNEEDQEAKKVLGKRPETKPMPSVVVKAEPKPVEKGWNTKEALMKIAGKVEKVVEDLQDDEEEPVFAK